MSKYPEGKFERHALNVPGPFYIEDGQCINCLAPCDTAPQLIGFFEETPELRGYAHCYVKQQPTTAAEMRVMLRAMQAACCSGLRYCGDDPEVLRQLREAGLEGRCDELWREETDAATNTASPVSAEPNNA